MVTDMTHFGLAFDVDGVIADTEPVVAEATIRMFRELYDTEMTPADFRPFIGTGAVRYVEGPAEKYGVAADIDAALASRHKHYVQLLHEAGNLALPGVHALIDAAVAAQDWKVTLATASPGEKSRETLMAAHVDPSRLDAWIHGDQIMHKKPHPEIYLAAAEAMGLTPHRCVAVEDAVSGVAAAKAAGMRCVAVTNSFSAKELGQADTVVTSLCGVRLEALRALVAAP